MAPYIFLPGNVKKKRIKEKYFGPYENYRRSLTKQNLHVANININIIYVHFHRRAPATDALAMWESTWRTPYAKGVGMAHCGGKICAKPNRQSGSVRSHANFASPESTPENWFSRFDSTKFFVVLSSFFYHQLFPL